MERDSHDDDPVWLDDYQKIHNEVLTKFINDSKAIGDDVGKQADLVKKAFDAHKTFILVAGRHNRPTANDLQALLKPLSDGIIAVQNFRESNRPSKQINFLATVAEGIPFLGWVAVAPKPAAYIVQMEESSQFYTNKILKQFRQSDPKLANWSNSWIKLLKGFQQYVKDNHTIGLQWNKEKPAATAASASAVSNSGGAPPPPCVGPPPSASSIPSGASVGKGDTSALFEQISQGSAVTAGLKKVTNDMQTHKNPTLRQTAKADASSPRSSSSPGSKPATKPVKKPPVFALQQKTWVVEWQENNQNLVIEDTNIKQTVYMFKCNNSVLQVRGKLNTITMDSCKKCGIVFEDLISACEFVNCESIKAQANGDVPTISIEKTDGAQIYLNKKSLGTQIISAKSSEMNVCITKENGDLTEFPLVEQYKTVWNGKTFVTTPMDLKM